MFKRRQRTQCHGTEVKSKWERLPGSQRLQDHGACSQLWKRQEFIYKGSDRRCRCEQAVRLLDTSEESWQEWKLRACALSSWNNTGKKSFPRRQKHDLQIAPMWNASERENQPGMSPHADSDSLKSVLAKMGWALGEKVEALRPEQMPWLMNVVPNGAICICVTSSKSPSLLHCLTVHSVFYGS